MGETLLRYWGCGGAAGGRLSRHCRMLSSTPGLCPQDANSSPPPPSHDNPRCLQSRPRALVGECQGQGRCGTTGRARQVFLTRGPHRDARLLKREASCCISESLRTCSVFPLWLPHSRQPLEGPCLPVSFTQVPLGSPTDQDTRAGRAPAGKPALPGDTRWAAILRAARSGAAAATLRPAPRSEAEGELQTEDDKASLEIQYLTSLPIF